MEEGSNSMHWIFRGLLTIGGVLLLIATGCRMFKPDLLGLLPLQIQAGYHLYQLVFGLLGWLAILLYRKRISEDYSEPGDLMTQSAVIAGLVFVGYLMFSTGFNLMLALWFFSGTIMIMVGTRTRPKGR